MKSTTALLLTLLMPLFPAYAYVHCDSVEKGLEHHDEQQKWKALFEQRNFREIDARFAAVLQQFEAGKLSDEEAAAFFWMFESSHPRREALHQDWITAYPRSEAAHLARAFYYTKRAWEARGTAFASDTSRSQFEAMEQSFEQALKSLDAAERLTRKPTIEWGKRIEVMQAVGGRSQTAAIYDRAIREFPQTVFVRSAYVMAASPHWGGSPERLRQILEDAKPLSAPDRRYLEARVEHMLGMAQENILKNNERAAVHFERAMANCVGISLSASRVMYLYQRTNNHDGMVRAASRFLERHPASGWALEQRGWAYHQLAQHAKAFADYKQATQLGRAWAFMALGGYYEKGLGGAPKDDRKALDLYTIAVEKGDKEAPEHLARVRARLGLK